MSYKGSRSRVANKKQFDDNFDQIKKIPKSKSTPGKKLVLPLTGRITRYTFS